MELQLSATWILEVVACVLSFGFLAAMAGVLGYANHQAVVGWHGLTLNTIISILGTASKLCAMFVLGAAIAQSKWAIFSHSPRSLLEFEAVEQAGRGAFGAAKLLCTTRKVATVGAIAILLSLAFDPFAQQIVQFDQDMDWKNSSAATIPRAQRFSAGSRVNVAAVATPTNYTRVDGGWGGVHIDTDFSVQSSVLYGLSHSMENVTQQLPALCPTGNCTWMPSETLAVCSICNDISASVRKSKTASAHAFVDLDTANPPELVSNNTRFSLPGGLVLDNFEAGLPTLYMTTFGTGDVAKTVSMADLDTMIWSMSILRLSEAQRSENWPPSSPVQALECALHYCVKQYQTNVTNSTITQVSTEIAAPRNPASWQPSVPGVRYLNMSRSSKASLEFDSTVSYVKRTDLMLGNGYNVSQKAVDSISDYFQRTFSDNKTSGRVAGVNGYFMESIDTQFAPSAIQPLLNSTDLTVTFAALAESLSNAIRAGGDGKFRQDGQVGTPVTKYRISWPWITLPAIVVFFALLQLAITMWTSRHAPLWKSSTLATLSRGAYIGNFLEEASTVQEMHTAAGSQPVHLFSHTAPGGVAVVANSNMVKKDLARVSVRELNDFSSPSSPTGAAYGQSQQLGEAPDYMRASTR